MSKERKYCVPAARARNKYSTREAAAEVIAASPDRVPHAPEYCESCEGWHVVQQAPRPLSERALAERAAAGRIALLEGVLADVWRWSTVVDGSADKVELEELRCRILPKADTDFELVNALDKLEAREGAR